jgi:hypothetical protein
MLHYIVLSRQAWRAAENGSIPPEIRSVVTLWAQRMIGSLYHPNDSQLNSVTPAKAKHI